VKNFPTVAVIAVACIVSITILSWHHIDVTALLAILMTVVGSIAVSTHTQTNGNTSKLIDLVDKQSTALAASNPIAPVTPPAPVVPPAEDPGTGA
jgi:hypothetical protein